MASPEVMAASLKLALSRHPPVAALGPGGVFGGWKLSGGGGAVPRVGMEDGERVRVEG